MQLYLMSNLKELIDQIILKHGTLRIAENKTGVRYWKLQRMHTGTDAMETDIDTLEKVRKALKISPANFWQKLIGGK